jgi:hypothetical protein
VRALLLVTLGAGALLNVALALVVISRPDEARYGEAIIYEQAGRLLHGQPLYQPLDQAPYTVTAYTPLYYWLAALLRLAFGPGFGPGRALSFAAGLAAAALVGYLSWRRTRAAWPALAAALLFLALGLVGPIPWFASYKEDVLAVALSLGAIAALDGRTSTRRVSIAAVLAALAILTKQTMVPAALAGSIWLLACRRPRLAALFAAIVGAVALGPLLVLERTTHALLANTVLANVNPFSTTAFAYNLILLALFQTGPLLAAVAYVVRRRPLRALGRDLLPVSWLASIVPVLGLAKEGADYNYWQLFAATTAMVVAAALWELRDRPSGALSGLALSTNAVAAMVIIGTVAIHDPGLTRAVPGEDAGFGGLVETARLAPHAVLADPLDVPVLADRSVVLEPVIYKLFHQTGQWDPDPIVEQVCSGQVSLLVLGYPLGSGPADAAQAEHQWPSPVLAAFRDGLVLREVVPVGSGQRYVYAPDPARRGCATASPTP